MDFLIELVVEIIGGILEGIIESDRVSKWARSAVSGVLCLGLATLFGIGFFNADSIGLMIFLGILILGSIAAFIFLVVGIYRSGTLRQAKKEDLPEVLKIYRSVIGKNGCDWTAMYPNEVTLHEDFSTGNLYVLCRGKKLIGAASIAAKNELDKLPCWYYREQPREIARIVIKPEYQSKGYGKHLVNKLCHKLEYMHCQVVHLLVSPENHPALNLFRETKFQNKGQCQHNGHTYHAYERKL